MMIFTNNNALNGLKEEYSKVLQKLRPIDDTFMRAMFQDNLPLAEYVLGTILGDVSLKLISCETQKDLIRLSGARSLELDVYCEDTAHRIFDLEIQRSDKGAKSERARYHASVLDLEKLDASSDFNQLPDTFVIVITENDLYGVGSAVYPIVRRNEITGQPFNDRQYIYYVNASYKGDDAIGRLMHDFLCADPEDMYCQPMAEKARYLKRKPGGVKAMCKLMDDLCEKSMQLGMQEGEQQTKIIDLKNIMENFQISAIQAMDILKVPAEKRKEYEILLFSDKNGTKIGHSV